jgi:carbohydrate diacid regulator
VLLLDTENPTQAKAIMTDIKAVLQQQLHIDCAIGIGRICRDPQELKLSYESAQLACNTSRDTPDHQIVVFELFDLALLISTVNRRHLQQVFNYVFRNYADNATIDESVNILQVYIDANRSVDQTAQILSLHKNTVQYRLNKIHELTGYNPRSARDLTFLHTAVLIHHMGIRKTNELL